MFCSKCGKENTNNSTFCSNCGSKLSFNVTQSYPNQGGIRKHFKLISQSKPKGPQIILIVITFIILAILLSVYGYFFQDNAFYNSNNLTLSFILAVLIPTALISICAYILVMNLSLKQARNQSVKLKDAFNFKNVTKIIPAIILFFLYFALYIGSDYVLCTLTNDIDIIDFISLLIGIITIYIYPVIDIFVCASIDEKNYNKSTIEILKESNKIINHHRIEYYAIYISFIGWYLLSPLTLFLLLLWLIPYINLTFANYYLHLKGELKIEPTEKGLNSSAVLGLFIGILIGILLLIGIIVSINEETPQFDYSTKNYETNEYNEEATIIYDDDKSITFKVPSGFKLEDPTDDGRGYYNDLGDYIYYYISYYNPSEYDNMKNDYINSIKEIYDKVKYINEYKVTINNQEVNVFKITITDDGITYEETTAFYTINDKYAVEINIGIEGITKNNITDYIKIKDYSVSF